MCNKVIEIDFKFLIKSDIIRHYFLPNNNIENPATNNKYKYQAVQEYAHILYM